MTLAARCTPLGSESESGTWGSFCTSTPTAGYTAAAVTRTSVVSESESPAWALLGNSTETDMFDAAFEDQATLAELYGILTGDAPNKF